MYKERVQEARNHLIEATKILNGLIDEEVQATDLQDWMKDRVELWCRVFNEGSVVTKEQLHGIWVDVMHKDARGLGGFFTGKPPTLTNIPPEKVALTQTAADTIEAWTGQNISEYAKKYKQST